MKQVIQGVLGKFGYRIVRTPPYGLDAFFSLLNRRSFKPSHIVDVGANRGTWTRHAIKYFPDAQYTLIEPQEHLRSSLMPLLNDKVKWIIAGAGDKAGSLPFHINPFDGSSSFVNGGSIIVPVTTLNEVAKPIPELVKIDAEGFDLKVMAGASDLIGKTEIFLLEALFYPDGYENTLPRVIEAMNDYGYRLLDVTDLNRTPRDGILWTCEVAFLLKKSRLLNGETYLGS